MDATNSADSSTTAPLNARAFDSHKWILEIQTLLADFVHYQNHVRLTALANLPEFVTPPEEQEKAHIITCLTEEQAQPMLHSMSKSTDHRSRQWSDPGSQYDHVV